MEVDWNGSGMHANFSTKYMREVGGKEYFEALMAAFDKYKDEHIAVYGPDNHLRLTGLHETQSIDKFNYGVANRGASVRVPHSFVNNGYRGYLEDRRPNSQGDPYQIAGRILQTIEHRAYGSREGSLASSNGKPHRRAQAAASSRAGRKADTRSRAEAGDRCRRVARLQSHASRRATLAVPPGASLWCASGGADEGPSDVAMTPQRSTVEHWGFFCWSSEGGRGE